jgi:hypothetical protein
VVERRRRWSRSWSNALDAGPAGSVTIEYGGKRLLRVEDDSIGMSPDDARMWLERRATNKIRSAATSAPCTLGFRGRRCRACLGVRHAAHPRTRHRGNTGFVVVAGQIETSPWARAERTVRTCLTCRRGGSSKVGRAETRTSRS